MTAGNAVDTLCQLGRAVVLAYLGGLEMVGLIVLAYAVCAPINALASLSLRAAVVTDARREYDFGDYLALRLVMATLAFGVIAVIGMTGYSGEMGWLILAAGGAEFFKSISQMLHSFQQRYERMDRIAISVMIVALSSIAVLASVVYFTGSILLAAIGFPLVTASVLFGYDIPNGVRLLRAAAKTSPTSERLRPSWNMRTMLRLIWLTLPLGVVMMMISLTSSIPRCLIGHHLGPHALGVFASVLSLGLVGMKVVNSMGQSAGPRLATYYAAGKTDAYLRLLGKLVALAGALGIAAVAGVAALGEPILELLYHEDYSPYWRLAVYLMIAAALLYLTIPLGRAVEAMRRFKTHMLIRAAAILVMLGAMPGMIRAYGLEGAAGAMILSVACSVLGCAGVVLWAVRREQPNNSVSLTNGELRRSVSQ